MPLTFPAHQAPVLPLKLRWPHAFDGTALVVAAAAPDLAYPMGSWLGRQSHTAIGVSIWAVPVTVVICWLLRWRAAEGLFAQLPDCGPLRLASYGALARRRPAFHLTVLSASIGATSHVVIDAFTHRGRWGASLLGLNTVIADLPVRGEFTIARALQYTGHTVGSVVGLAMFARIGRARLMERWYGADVVQECRGIAVRLRQRLSFWLVVLTGVAAGFLLAESHRPFALITGGTFGLIAGGLLPTGAPRDGTATAPSRRRWPRRSAGARVRPPRG